MGFFSSIWNGAKSVVGGAVKAVTGVADGILKKIPVIGSVYSGLTNALGADIGSLGQVINNGIKGNGLRTDAKVAERAAAQTEAQQVEQLMTMLNQYYGIKNNTDSLGGNVGYSTTGILDGVVYPQDGKLSGYDASGLTLPVSVESGYTNQQIYNSLVASGQNPTTVANNLLKPYGQTVTDTQVSSPSFNWVGLLAGAWDVLKNNTPLGGAMTNLEAEAMGAVMPVVQQKASDKIWGWIKSNWWLILLPFVVIIIVLAVKKKK